MKFARLALCAALLTACTPNGVLVTNGGGGNVANVTRINVSISAFGQVSTPAGPALGFSPEITNVTVGSGVQFVNVDNTSHTATAIAGATSFPAVSPFTFSATQPASAPISGKWSAGTMQAGTSSAVFAINQPGTYLYGCFFHYSGGMRGVIIAK